MNEIILIVAIIVSIFFILALSLLGKNIFKINIKKHRNTPQQSSLRTIQTLNEIENAKPETKTSKKKMIASNSGIINARKIKLKRINKKNIGKLIVKKSELEHL